MAAKKSPVSKVSALIAKARMAHVATTLTGKAKSDVAEIMDYNDTAPCQSRVTVEAVRELLKGHGILIGRTQFPAMIRRTFGRGWEKK